MQAYKKRGFWVGLVVTSRGSGGGGAVLVRMLFPSRPRVSSQSLPQGEAGPGRDVRQGTAQARRHAACWTFRGPASAPPGNRGVTHSGSRVSFFTHPGKQQFTFW